MTDDTVSDNWHLARTTTDRGLGHLPPIPSEYGGNIRVYESSAADGPHLWVNVTAPVSLNDPDGPRVAAPMHLTADNARRLAEQLLALVDGHYQND